MLKMKPIKKRQYEHMESVIDPVREVCPETGRYIEPREIPKILTVRHFLLRRGKLPHPLDKYREIGAENLTEQQLESAYTIIKGFKPCKIVG